MEIHTDTVEQNDVKHLTHITKVYNDIRVIAQSLERSGWGLWFELGQHDGQHHQQHFTFITATEGQATPVDPPANRTVMDSESLSTGGLVIHFKPFEIK